jgi:uncharacterized protein (TIGR02996 family)
MKNELLKDILRRPDDDSPRLVLADWLSERGDPRGEFITLQCALARMDPSHEGFAPTWARCERLLRDNRAPRAAELEAKLAAQQWANRSLEINFHRGFIEELTLSPDQFEAHAEWLCQKVPLRKVTLSWYRDTSLLAIASSPVWHRLRAIALHNLTSQLGSAADLLVSPYEVLEEFDITECGFGVRGIQLLIKALADSPLRRLVLHGNRIGNGGVGHLLKSGLLARLIELDLGANKITDRGLDALLSSDNLGKLRSFSLAGTPKTTIGQKLARWPGLAQMQRLNLRGAMDGTQLDALFAADQELRHLSRLDLRSCMKHLDQTRAQRLANLPFANLSFLKIGNGRIGPQGMKALAASATMSHLVHLNARINGIGDEGVEAIVNSPYLTRLVHLDLSKNKLSNRSLEALAQWPGLKNMTHLDLSNNGKIREAGLQALIDSPYLDPVAIELWGSGVKHNGHREMLWDRFKTSAHFEHGSWTPPLGA